jgi:hypothetical protein
MGHYERHSTCKLLFFLLSDSFPHTGAYEHQRGLIARISSAFEMPLRIPHYPTKDWPASTDRCPQRAEIYAASPTEIRRPLPAPGPQSARCPDLRQPHEQRAS